MDLGWKNQLTNSDLTTMLTDGSRYYGVIDFPWCPCFYFMVLICDLATTHMLLFSAEDVKTWSIISEKINTYSENLWRWKIWLSHLNCFYQHFLVWLSRWNVLPQSYETFWLLKLLNISARFLIMWPSHSLRFLPVISEMILAPESFTAYITRIRAFVCVCPLMN